MWILMTHGGYNSRAPIYYGPFKTREEARNWQDHGHVIGWQLDSLLIKLNYPVPFYPEQHEEE